MIPGKMIKGMGGAMDLVAGVNKVVVIMDHTAKDGSPKLLNACDLPLTGSGVADLLITNLGVFDFQDSQPVLIELAPEVSLEEITEKTQAEFTVCPKLGRHLHNQ